MANQRVLALRDRFYKQLEDPIEEVQFSTSTFVLDEFVGYGVEGIIYTDIGRDGMLTGVNIEATVRLAQAVDVPGTVFDPGLNFAPWPFVTAEVEVATDQVPVRVAKSALQTIEGKRVVFVRTEEGFEKREIEVGRSDDDAFEVVSGLKSGEEIAVANTFLLKAELGKSEADHDH